MRYIAGQVSGELRILPIMYDVNSFTGAGFRALSRDKIPSVSRSEAKAPAPKLKGKNSWNKVASKYTTELGRSNNFQRFQFPACWGCQLPWGDHRGLKCLPRMDTRLPYPPHVAGLMLGGWELPFYESHSSIMRTWGFDLKLKDQQPVMWLKTHGIWTPESETGGSTRFLKISNYRWDGFLQTGMGKKPWTIPLTILWWFQAPSWRVSSWFWLPPILVSLHSHYLLARPSQVGPGSSPMDTSSTQQLGLWQPTEMNHHSQKKHNFLRY